MLITDLECAARQWRAIFIGFKDFQWYIIFSRWCITKTNIYTHLPYSRLHHDNRLHTRTGCAGCVHIVTVYIHAGKELGINLFLRSVHLLRCGLGNTEQKGFTISHIIAVLVQVIVLIHMGQRKSLRAAVIIALVALAVHEECAGRNIVRTQKNLPILAITAHKGRACRRHRQHHVLLAVYFLFRERTAGYNTTAYVNRAGLLCSGGIFRIAGRVIDGSANPWFMSFTIWPPSVVELITILQHFNSGKQRQRFRRRAGAKRLAGSAITERRGAAIAYAIAAVCSNLRIAQRTPDRGLRCTEIHICRKVLRCDRRTSERNKLVERHAGVTAYRDAIHMHIRYTACHRVRHSRCAGVALAMIRTVGANFRAV